MSYQFIRVEQDEQGIVLLTIDDPEAKNAVNWAMNQEIIAEVDRVDADPEARALIVTGSGRIFCSGGNIRRMTSEGSRWSRPTRPRGKRCIPAPRTSAAWCWAFGNAPSPASRR